MFKRKKAPPISARNRPQVERGPTKVFSYHANRDSAETEKTQQKRNRNKVLAFAALASRTQPAVSKSQKSLLFLGFTALVVLLAYNVFLTSTPQIKVLGKAEDRLLLQKDSVYKAAAQESLQQSYTSRTKLTINTETLEAGLLKQYPELAAAKVTLPLFGHTPVVELVPAKSVAVFAATDGKSYILANSGRLIATNTSSIDSLPVVTDQSGLSSSLGGQVLPAGDVTFITRLVYQLSQKGLSITSVTLPAAGREVDIRFKDTPYFVKFSLAGDVLQQAGAFDAVQAQLRAGKATPAEYVDVRVGDRVYYK